MCVACGVRERKESSGGEEEGLRVDGVLIGREGGSSHLYFVRVGCVFELQEAS